jgi:sulfite exporter TauE/SafE
VQGFWILAYMALGVFLGAMGVRYDIQRRPGMKSREFLFAEFILVVLLWPIALLLVLVVVSALKLNHLLYHRDH